MDLEVLLVKQPVAERIALFFIQQFPHIFAEGINGKCGDPCGQVRVNRPATVIPNGIYQKLHTSFDHGMICNLAAGQAHGHEASEGCGLKEAAIWRLDFPEHLQCLFSRCVADHSCDWIPRGSMMMLALADGDQRGKRVTHHRQSQCGKPILW